MGYMSKEPKIKPIVIVGAGGMGRDTQWLIERINEEEPTYEILGYIDDGIQQGSIIDGLSDSWRNEIPSKNTTKNKNLPSPSL